MAKPIKNNKTERVNINVTVEQKEQFFNLATAEGLSVTDYILWKCLELDKPETTKKVIDPQNNALLEYQVITLQEQLERERKALDEQKELYKKLFDTHNGLAQSVALNNVPWYKRRKYKELTNKT